VDGGIGLAAAGEPQEAEVMQFVELTRHAASRATESLSAEPHERRSRRVSR